MADEKAAADAKHVADQNIAADSKRVADEKNIPNKVFLIRLSLV